MRSWLPILTLVAVAFGALLPVAAPDAAPWHAADDDAPRSLDLTSVLTFDDSDPDEGLLNASPVGPSVAWTAAGPPARPFGRATPPAILPRPPQLTSSR